MGSAHNFLSLYALPFLAAAILIILLGYFVFHHNRKSLTHVSYLLLCSSVFVWLASNYLALSALNPKIAFFWSKFAYVGVTLIPPAVYLFAVNWLGQFEKKKRNVILNYLIGIALIFLMCFTNLFTSGVRKFFFGYFAKLTLFGLFYLSYFFYVFGTFFLILFRAHSAETNPEKKVHIRYVLIAFLIAFAGSVDFLVSYGLNVYPISFLTICFFVLMIAYTIIFYRLMDIKTIIHKTIMWVITSVVAAAPLITFFFLAKSWLLGLDKFPFLVMMVAIFFLFGFYTRRILPAVDHLFQRRRWDLARALENFNEELVHLKDLEQLISHIDSTVKKVLYVSNVSTLVRYENSDMFIFLMKSESSPKFDASHVFLKWLSEHDEIVFKDYMAVDAKFAPILDQVSDYFKTTKAEICIPLVVNERLIGVLNLGAKQNLERFRFAEINFLSDLRRSAAIALSNSLHLVALQENLKRWSVELEKKVEERTKELVETQQQLVQAEKLATLGTLAGGVAHEINNPLTAVLTNAQILKMDARPEDLESLNLIEDGAKRCRAIVQKMMKYARKSEGGETLEKVDINQAVSSVIRFLKYQFEQDNVALATEEGSEPMVILGNLNELEQVLTNLLLNAKDAVHQVKDEKKVGVKVVSDLHAAGFIVSDNGVGITKENLSKIFDPFFTTKDVGKGTGLGLAVTQSIVQKFGGHIKVSSEPGKGTAFTVIFPKAESVK